ncbi:Mitochondrial import inner membrane translocase subunit TIM22 [Wickerhamomyces ciferrii]|uniref:Mitochondrial import inner membrane translocase subunit TIM22 n=1 Tax=Wickerhamomyces ciferrii (strain ATCC 14091 / BCRC 22168 / CBS 111 / JCM 3599 / NBRC 0793 / NRRL Y-1031 F-60-10) TaxID=1206466 RepID=K0KK51_WICCF|nr:Mitochondrial import inner membrane translocase subunit TIM22 [Wickerhamomyces ciferrii]CCH42552.1 Mitochondrial import inner membrane translocase subunit TIM22 [Wickerhamomyces ciferrii]
MTQQESTVDEVTASQNGRLPIKYPTPFFNKEEPYEPLDTSSLTKGAFCYSATVGLLAAATRNAISNDSKHISGIVTKHGRLWGAITAVITSYQFSYAAISNLREKNDYKNDVLSGAISGAILGSFKKSLSASLGTGLALGLLGGLLRWSGGLLGTENNAINARGKGIDSGLVREQNSNGDEEFKQGFWEVVRRRPLSHTKEFLGDAWDRR